MPLIISFYTISIPADAFNYIILYHKHSSRQPAITIEAIYFENMNPILFNLETQDKSGMSLRLAKKQTNKNNFEESCHLKGREGRFQSCCYECKASTFTL